MTNARDLAEAINLSTTLSDLLIDRGGPRGQNASVLRRKVTAFQANLETGYRRETLGVDIIGLFTAALAAGVSASTFQSVRSAAVAALARDTLTIWTQQSFRRHALIAETRRWATTTFTDRDAVDAVRASLVTDFDGVIEDASETGEYEVMRSFTTLFTAIQRHLLSSAVPLPRVVQYSTPVPLPSLVLAHRLYADASRASEIELENCVIHPLFMPTSGRALAS